MRQQSNSLKRSLLAEDHCPIPTLSPRKRLPTGGGFQKCEYDDDDEDDKYDNDDGIGDLERDESSECHSEMLSSAVAHEDEPHTDEQEDDSLARRHSYENIGQLQEFLESNSGCFQDLMKNENGSNGRPSSFTHGELNRIQNHLEPSPIGDRLHRADTSPASVLTRKSSMDGGKTDSSSRVSDSNASTKWGSITYDDQEGAVLVESIKRKPTGFLPPRLDSIITRKFKQHLPRAHGDNLDSTEPPRAENQHAVSTANTKASSSFQHSITDPSSSTANTPGPPPPLPPSSPPLSPLPETASIDTDPLVSQEQSTLSIEESIYYDASSDMQQMTEFNQAGASDTLNSEEQSDITGFVEPGTQKDKNTNESEDEFFTTLDVLPSQP
eukprot:gene1197-4410_t